MGLVKLTRNGGVVSLTTLISSGEASAKGSIAGNPPDIPKWGRNALSQWMTVCQKSLTGRVHADDEKIDLLLPDIS